MWASVRRRLPWLIDAQTDSWSAGTHSTEVKSQQVV
jgi:hypothetical protein